MPHEGLPAPPSPRTWALATAIGAGLSAILGFGREVFISYQYGATGLTDAFFVAVLIPDFFGAALGAAFTSAIVPVLKAARVRSEAEAARLATLLLGACTALLLAISAGGLAGVHWLVPLLAPGFSEAQKRLTATLIRIAVLAVVPCGLSGVLWGFHSAHGRYRFPAVQGIVHNLCFLAVAWVLGQRLGIVALAWGTVAAFLARCLVQLIPIVGTLSWPQHWWHPGIGRVLRAAGPVLIATGLTNAALMVDRMLSSELSPGHLTALNIANKLGLAPYSLIGTALAAALFPRFVDGVLAKDWNTVRRALAAGTSWALFAGSSIGFVFLGFGPALLAVLFQHGNFTAADVRLASGPLTVYGVMLPFYLLVPLYTQVFMAQGRSKLPMTISILATAVDVGGSICVVHPWGIVGLVIANAAAQVVWFGAALWVLRREWARQFGEWLRDAMAPAILPILAMATGLLGVRVLCHDVAGWSTFYCLGAGAGAGILGTWLVLLYAPASTLTHLVRWRAKAPRFHMETRSPS